MANSKSAKKRVLVAEIELEIKQLKLELKLWLKKF